MTKAYPHELAQFHTQSYVDFLSRITPNNAHLYPQVRPAAAAAQTCCNTAAAFTAPCTVLLHDAELP